MLTPAQAILILLAVVLTVAAIVFAMTETAVQDGLPEPVTEPGENAAPSLEEYENYDEFLRAYELIMENYVDSGEVTPESLMRGAIQGMVQGIGDPYSTYFDASALEDLRRRTLDGQYSGIGVSVIDIDGYVTVMVPFSGTPAATTPFEGAGEDDEPGLRSGDRILEVDGVDVVGMSTEHVAELIRGPAGELVEIRVERSQGEMGWEELLFPIERREIEIPTVESRVFESDLGYLSISQFTAQTPEQVASHLAELEEAGIVGLLIDLRSNPGGTLEESIEVADQFLSPGPVVITVDREGESTTIGVDGPGYSLPMIVLVDGFSASASEIIAGALRDRAGVVLVGERTFGKGSVQRVYYLDRTQTTGMKITTQRYLTPSGYSIEEEGGLVPDVEVPWSEGDIMGDPESDPQLRKALELLRESIGD